LVEEFGSIGSSAESLTASGKPPVYTYSAKALSGLVSLPVNSKYSAKEKGNTLIS
jgi:hypothetical protein